jgi:hypothetical protein
LKIGEFFLFENIDRRADDAGSMSVYPTSPTSPTFAV